MWMVIEILAVLSVIGGLGWLVFLAGQHHGRRAADVEHKKKLASTKRSIYAYLNPILTTLQITPNTHDSLLEDVLAVTNRFEEQVQGLIKKRDGFEKSMNHALEIETELRAQLQTQQEELDKFRTAGELDKLLSDSSGKLTSIAEELNKTSREIQNAAAGARNAGHMAEKAERLFSDLYAKVHGVNLTEATKKRWDGIIDGLKQAIA